jgi:DNA-cytosine methyltransferase
MINELSLFNGMSFGAMALESLGIEVGKRYSSEIDKYANQATQALFPNTIQLGDILNWREWDIDWASIDLVTGGFPCQAWSMAGKQLGDKDERGMLFWTMLDIIKHAKHYNPDVQFLIENVKMKKEFEQYITTHTENALGKVYKVLINSALVSAQNRNRYYWTSFEVEQPEDKGIVLKDIIESNLTDEFNSDNWHKWFFKNIDKQILKSYSCINNFNDKAITMTARQFASWNENFLIIKQKGIKDIQIDLATQPPYSFYETRTELGKQLRRELSRAKGKDTSARCTKSKMYKSHNHKKANCLTAARSFFETILDTDYRVRKLTPRECFRLQTVPEHHIDTLLNSGISNTQLYKMCGNGWTMEVIAHIFKSIIFK